MSASTSLIRKGAFQISTSQISTPTKKSTNKLPWCLLLATRNGRTRHKKIDSRNARDLLHNNISYRILASFKNNNYVLVSNKDFRFDRPRRHVQARCKKRRLPGSLCNIVVVELVGPPHRLHAWRGTGSVVEDVRGVVAANHVDSPKGESSHFYGAVSRGAEHLPKWGSARLYSK